MITIKNKQAQASMREAGKLLAELFVLLSKKVVPGVSTLSLDNFIELYLDEHKLVSQTKGFQSYRHASCISINDEVVHGIPNAATILREGDLVKIDVCASWNGFCADMARCFFVGVVSEELQLLVDVASSSLDKGIACCVVGNRVSDISAAIQHEVEWRGFGVVREFAGHGIGRRMHEDPEILNYGRPGRGQSISEGMAFALEPMITKGNPKTYVAKDGWTAKTVDKSFAAHVEDTVIVTESGPLVITRF